MVGIYVLSAQPVLGTGLGVWDAVLRKLAHMVEFGLLFVLLVFGAGRVTPRVVVAAAAVAVLYAASDELHQSTVEGRVGTPVDVAIDAAGVGLAVLLTVVLARRRQRPPTAPRPARPAPRTAEPAEAEA